MREQVSQVQREHPGAQVGLWSEDEARFGLQPVLKRCWARRGQRPVAVINPRYGWTWSYGAVNMQTGESFFLLLPALTKPCVEIFLREYVRAQGLGKDKIACLLWDGAPAHRAALEVPEGVILLRLPPYAPELNPSERLWLPLREAVANRYFRELEEMEEVLLQEMRDLGAQKEYLSAMTNYHWLPPV